MPNGGQITEGDIVLRTGDPRPWQVEHIFRDGSGQIQLYCADEWIRDLRVPLSELTLAPAGTPAMRTPHEILSECDRKS